MPAPTAVGAACRCTHNQSRHTVPGLDGECVAERCRCTAYTPRDRTSPPRRTPVAVPAGERALVAAAWTDTLIAEIDAHAGSGAHDHSKRRAG